MKPHGKRTHSPQGWPLTRKGWLEAGQSPADPFNDFDREPGMVESVAKRYADGRLGILQHLDLYSRLGSPPHQWGAIFYRPIEPTSIELDLFSGLEIADVQDRLPYVWCEHGYWQKAMFVEVVDKVDDRERVNLGPIRSVVRLQRFDLLHPLIGHPAEPASFHGAYPFLLGLCDWELVTESGFFPVGDHELPHEGIKARAEVPQDVAEDQSELFFGDLATDDPARLVPPGLGVVVDGDCVRAVIDKSLSESIEGLSVSVRTTELCQRPAEVSHGQ